VTVSGLSSGGLFAHQFHVAFSRTVLGAAMEKGPMWLKKGDPGGTAWRPEAYRRMKAGTPSHDQQIIDRDCKT
jgi:hypothetical protein